VEDRSSRPVISVSAIVRNRLMLMVALVAALIILSSIIGVVATLCLAAMGGWFGIGIGIGIIIFSYFVGEQNVIGKKLNMFLERVSRPFTFNSSD
jgi:hypothetical protein